MATTTFNDLITFSRGSNATVTGPNGLIQWAPANLLTNSQDFEAAAWTKTGSSVTANAAVAPDGTTTADSLIEDTSTGFHRVTPGVAPTIVSGTAYSATIYAKAATRTEIRLTENATTGAFATFNLLNGAIVSSGSGGTGVAVSVGDGWYRCELRFTSAGTAGRIDVQISNAGSVSYTGNGTSGILIWGAQLELGSTATTYNNTSVRNLLGFSEAFDNAAWTKSGASIVTGAQANPVNGLFNAQKLMEDTANAEHRVFGFATTAGASHTFSVYMKAAERTWARLRINDSVPMGRTAWFNLSNGTVGTVQTNLTASIASVGNGWYRCSVTVSASSVGSIPCQ